MPVYDLQTSFAGGEISPDLSGRVDVSKYKIGCKTLRNFIASPHGPAYSRPGTYYVASTADGSKKSRLIEFVFSTTQSYVLEFGDLYIRFYRDGAQILATGVPYQIASPYLETELNDIKFVQSADTIYLAHPNHAPQILQRVADTDWTLSDYVFENGPYQFPNIDTTFTMTYVSSSQRLTSSQDFFDGGHVGALIQLNHDIEAKFLISDITGSTSTVLYGKSWRLFTSGTWTGTITISVTPTLGGTIQVVQKFRSNNDSNFNTFGDESAFAPDGFSPVTITCDIVVSSGTLHINYSVDAFTLTSNVEITSIVSPIQAHIDTSNTYVTILVPDIATSDWAEGSWSTFRGFPSVIAFIQDRLVWGNTPTEPQTAWLTKTSNYTNFGRSSPLVDDDGITVNLNSRQVNPIRSIRTFLNSAVLFTDNTEWSISSSSDGPITPTTIQVKLQGTRGASSVDPILIGNRIIFIDPLSSTVRDMIYEYFTNTFQSENISIFSDHLFKGHSIVDMAYQQEPDSLLWLVRDDGVLLCCTYMREQEVLAWSRHDTYDGAHLFESVCTIPGDDATEVWFIVKRGSNRYVERMILRTVSTDPADQFFVDCGATYDGAGVGSVSGYDYLDGFNAAINAEGFELPQQLISGGVVTFDTTRAKAQIGLPYVPDLETLNPEVQLQDGALYGRKYQINRAVIRFLNTIGGKAGSDLDTLDSLVTAGQPSMRDASLAATTPTPLYSDFVSIPIRASNNPHGHIAIRQTSPFPITVLGIMPVVAPGQLP